MSMPEIPPQEHRPNACETYIDLLESIALEETALSHLLNAEAEKIQYFICRISSCTPPEVLIDFNVVVNETLETIIMKEWLLLRKLEKVSRIFNKQFPPKPHPGSTCKTCSTCTTCSSCSHHKTCSSCSSCKTCQTCSACTTCKPDHGCGCR